MCTMVGYTSAKGGQAIGLQTVKKWKTSSGLVHTLVGIDTYNLNINKILGGADYQPPDFVRQYVPPSGRQAYTHLADVGVYGLVIVV